LEEEVRVLRMATAGKSEKKKRKKTKRKKTILKIFHWKERFEIPLKTDKYKKGGLDFVRMYVGAGCDDESVSLYCQIQALSSRDDFDTLEVCFWRLVRYLAHWSHPYRGYVIDACQKPASPKAVGHIIGKDTNETKVIIDALKSVGLLETVEMPNFKKRPSEPPANPPQEDIPSENTPEGGKNDVPENSGTDRTIPEPFQEGEGVKGEASAFGLGKDEGEEKAASASPQPGKGKSEVEAEGAKPKANGEVGGRTSSAPTATPPIRPIKPTKADAGGGQGHRVSDTPPRSVFTCRNISGQLDSLYDPKCKEFAGDIFIKLFGRTPDPDQREHCREFGCFVHAWSAAQMGGLRPFDLAELRTKSMKEAAKIGRASRQGKVNKPGAVWCNSYHPRLRKMIQERGIKRVRDGPPL